MTQNECYLIYAPESRDAEGNEMSFQRGSVPIRRGRVLDDLRPERGDQAGPVDVAAGIAKFTGRVECDTLKANALVAQSGTPGAGSVWQAARQP